MDRSADPKESAVEKVQMPDAEAELEGEISKAVPGDVHDMAVRDFWMSLDPGSWVMQLLQEGYKIPISSEISSYEEPNNASAEMHSSFVKSQVQKLVQRGVVVPTDKKPICVNPLTVAARKLEDGSEKLRLCLDLSRCVNKEIKKEYMKLATFQTSLDMLLPGDFQAVYDLASAYHHIRVRAEDQALLGFRLPGAGRGQEDSFFMFTRLPFGLATAGAVLDRVTKPIRAKIAQLGIRHSIYIDDGHIMAQTREEAVQAVETVYSLLKKGGFKLAEQKSDSEAAISQVKE